MTKERLAEIEARAAEVASRDHLKATRISDEWIAHHARTDIPDLIAAVRELQAELHKERTVECWTCFHCGEFFDDAEAAREHFGPRDFARPAWCRGMLDAIAETFERYGIHRPRHNAASVKQLAQQRDEARAKLRESQAENERLRGDLARQQQLNINQAKTIRSWQCRPIEAARDGGEG